MIHTLPLTYVDQRVADLTFHLFESGAPRGSLQLLAEQRLRLGKGELTLAIIGSSHFLEIQSGETVLCEMLACPRPGLERIPRVAERAGESPWGYHLRRGDLSYRFERNQHGYSPTQFRRASERLSAGDPNRLLYLFPGGDGAGHALTCLQWRVEGKRAAITTYHTYPNELTIVRTRSVIDIAEEGAVQ